MKHVLALATLFPNAAHPRFGTFVARSLEALAQRKDWRVTVINPIGLPPIAVGRYRPLAQLPPVAVENGVTVYRPRFPLIPRLSARTNPHAIARAALPLACKIHTQSPIDVLDAEFFYPDGPAAARIARKLAIPLSIKARGADIIAWGQKGFARRQILDAAEHASGILAVSRPLIDDMERLGIERGKIALHYTGLDRERFRPRPPASARAQLSRELGFALPENAPLLVTVGALIERKQHDLILRAMTEIPAAYAIFVGTGEKEAMLRALARELGLEQRVHFAGSLDHDTIPAILSASDVMVLPSKSEGLANALVEALACGTPVVTTPVGGAPDLLTRPEAGHLVEPQPGAIAQAVKQLLADMPSPQKVSACVEAFSWDNHAALLAEHFEQVSAGTRG